MSEAAATAGTPVTVVDLGLGNLGSVLEALRRSGGAPVLSANPFEIASAPRVLVPGVAAVGLGMERAGAVGLGPALRGALDRGAPVMGICLGMQILFEEGDEDGTRKGLGLFPGRVTKLPKDVPQPHIGWQRLLPRRPSPLFPLRPGEQGPWTYFAHSYRCEAPDEVISATVEHGPAGGPPLSIAAVVSQGTLHGAQFHPEKSARGGFDLLSRFLALPAGARP